MHHTASPASMHHLPGRKVWAPSISLGSSWSQCRSDSDPTLQLLANCARAGGGGGWAGDQLAWRSLDMPWVVSARCVLCHSMAPINHTCALTSRLAMCQSNSFCALAGAWGSPPPASASRPPLWASHRVSREVPARVGGVLHGQLVVGRPWGPTRLHSSCTAWPMFGNINGDAPSEASPPVFSYRVCIRRGSQKQRQLVGAAASHCGASATPVYIGKRFTPTAHKLALQQSGPAPRTHLHVSAFVQQVVVQLLNGLVQLRGRLGAVRKVERHRL